MKYFNRNSEVFYGAIEEPAACPRLKLFEEISFMRLKDYMKLNRKMLCELLSRMKDNKETQLNWTAQNKTTAHPFKPH